MAHRTDIKNMDMERPSEEDVQATADRTRLALEKLTSGKIKAAKKSDMVTQGDVSYVRYTPQQGDGSKQRIIKMIEIGRAHV